ncbi:MAG: VTT domain-containing protein [Magnetococcus sp. MYC-9]
MSKRLIMLMVVVAALFLYGTLGRQLSLDSLKSQYHLLVALQAESPWGVAAAFFLSYVAMVALSLPGVTFMTLAGGALFGLGLGTLLVSFAASLGATAAFLLARYLLRDTLQHRFAEQLARINQGLVDAGVFYLLTLRLLPVVPSALVNLLMGVTALPTRTFYWVSQLGMLAATLIYVRAGTQLARLQHPSDLFNLELLGPLLALACLPLLVKQLLNRAGAWPFMRRSGSG